MLEGKDNEERAQVAANILSEELFRAFLEKFGQILIVSTIKKNHDINLESISNTARNDGRTLDYKNQISINLTLLGTISGIT